MLSTRFSPVADTLLGLFYLFRIGNKSKRLAQKSENVSAKSVSAGKEKLSFRLLKQKSVSAFTVSALGQNYLEVWRSGVLIHIYVT